MQRKIVERCFYDLKFKAHTVTVISSTNAFDDDNFCELIKKIMMMIVEQRFKDQLVTNINLMMMKYCILIRIEVKKEAVNDDDIIYSQEIFSI